MRFFICSSLFLCCFSFVQGQDFILSPTAKELCKPGVINKSPTKGILFEYEMTPNVRLQNLTGESSSSESGVNKRFNMKLKAPLVIRKDLKVIAGWNYYSEEYNFGRLQTDNFRLLSNINDRHLKSSRLTLSVIKPINDRHYLAVKAQASFNGDYDGVFDFDQKYANYDVATIFGVKKRRDVEWGVGLFYRHGGSLPVLPIAIYNQTFNTKWGIEAVIPSRVKLRYNINQKNILLFGPELDSRRYFVDNHLDRAYTMRRTDLKLALSYQRHLGSLFWMELSGGYVHNFSTRFETDQLGDDIPSTYDYNYSSSPFIKVGVFLSPSKILKKKRK